MFFPPPPPTPTLSAGAHPRRNSVHLPRCLFFFFFFFPSTPNAFFLLAEPVSGHNQRGEVLICYACGQAGPWGRGSAVQVKVPATNRVESPHPDGLMHRFPLLHAISTLIVDDFLTLNFLKQMPPALLST